MEQIVYIPFTGVGLFGGFRGDAWYKYRIELFLRYTLPSLRNQTKKDFKLWLSFRPQEKDNKLTHYLLSQIDIPYVATYDGLMYFDDKFSPGILKKVKNCARVIRDCIRNKSLKGFIYATKEILVGKNQSLGSRLESSLKQVNSSGDWVYLTRIDSDDMFHKVAIECISTYHPFEGAIGMKEGYIYSTETGEMAVWRPKTNPPFHTIIFKGDTFRDPKKHLAYYGGFSSHEDIPKIFETKVIQDRLYCVVAHGKHHISTTWNHPFKGEYVESKIEEFNIKN